MSTETPSQSKPPQASPDLKVLWTRLALFIAVVGVLGSLHLSLAMDPPLKACALCYYQRAFIMAVAGVLALGMFLPGVPLAGVTVLALSSAFAGLAMAGYHSWLDISGALECPKGITGVLAAPQEAFIVFLLLVGALLGDLFHRGVYVMQGFGAMLLGVVFCIACVRSVAKSDPPTAPYKLEAPDICRIPYSAAAKK
ncbi:MAG: disulfide bond formation protein B [Gammaproteobacteria bacterium]|nr:disulfide bond formation protein B [Gammaproteobacteria bacterium]